MIRALVTIAFGLAGAGPASSDDRPADLVIRGGRVIDPESGLDAVRNVVVRDGRIVDVTDRPVRGAHIIDASGLVVAPGFIDLHAHGQQLPAARMQAFDGVTTAMELESGVADVGEYYERVAREGRPINYGVSASWSDVRERILKDSAVADDEQLRRILKGLEQGLSEGALGIGITVGYAPESGAKEFHAINALAADRGVVTFSHIRYGSVIEPGSSFAALEEVIAVAATTGAQMHICHLNSSTLRDVDAAVKLIRSAQERGLPISVEAYPYSAASTNIGATFYRGPQWRERLGGARYEDFELNGQPLDERSFLELQTHRPDTLIVYNYLRPERNPLDQGYLDQSVLYPGGAIASDGVWWTRDGKLLDGDVWPIPADAYAHPRSAGTFTRLLRVYVRERQKLTLSQAIEKASLIPALILERSVAEMKNKGRLRAGADADIIVFDAQTVSDRATFERPAQTAAGMRYVIVNGSPVIANGQLIRSARPGRGIRRGSIDK
ncbi:amidohydrolase family protein [Steroidobacter flavus]|uniref:Amidohydrolase family protein n=1 Tax=Steroidobacter flavus TaxID=1842136 RepID=A0ABV8SZ24_9GAMM